MDGLSLLVSAALLAQTGSAELSARAQVAALSQFRWLEGRWMGEGVGPEGKHRLEREIVCALGCRYLNVESRLLMPEDADAPRGTLLSMWGWQSTHQRLVLHHFDDFSALTTYVEQPQADPARRVFLHEDRRTHTLLRITVEFQPPDAWRERYESAVQGGAWEVRVERRYERAAPALIASPIS